MPFRTLPRKLMTLNNGDSVPSVAFIRHVFYKTFYKSLLQDMFRQKLLSS